MKKNSGHTAHLWLVAGIFTVLTVGLFYLINAIVQPPEQIPVPPYISKYDNRPLLSALNETQLRNQVAQIRDASLTADAYSMGRMTGSPGFYRTEQLIINTWKQAGLDVKSQEFSVVVPVTEYCELCDDQGKPLPGIKLYPFEPNGMLPTALPKEGLTGPLVLTESTEPIDLIHKPLEGSIVLNRGLDCKWPQLASLGVKAVIVQEDALDQTGNPDAAAPWKDMSTLYDIHYPRFLARGPLAQYEGKPLRIRCKVSWQSKLVRNIVAVLHGAPSNKEALVVTCPYDSTSFVPDQAPGAEQALSLAAMLQLSQSIARYKGQLPRDIVFVATAAHAQNMEGALQLLESFENISARDRAVKTHAQLRVENEKKLQYAQHALQLLSGSVSSLSTLSQRLKQEDPGFHTWFDKCYRVMAGECKLRCSEAYLTTRLEWLRAGSPVFRPGVNLKKARAQGTVAANMHPLMVQYLAKKGAETRATDLLSQPFWTMDLPDTMVNSDPTSVQFTRSYYLRQFLTYLQTLQTYHQQQLRDIADALEMRRLFLGYQHTLTLNLELYSGGHDQQKDLAVMVGYASLGTIVEPQSSLLAATITDEAPKTAQGPALTATSWGSADAGGSTADPNVQLTPLVDMESEYWYICGRLAYTIVNKKFFPAKLGTPEDTFEHLSTAAVAQQLPVLGKAMLAIGYGKIPMKKITHIRHADEPLPFSGKVYSAGEDLAASPTQPLGRNTFVHLYQMPTRDQGMTLPSRGVHIFPIIATDPYGEYYRRFTFNITTAIGSGATIDAVRFGDDGQMLYYKDQSETAQSLMQNEHVWVNDIYAKRVDVILFRCCQMNCFQRINPQTFNAFARFDFMDAQDMQSPRHLHYINDADAPAASAFLEPDSSVFVSIMDGSPESQQVQTCRSFLLNVDPKAPITRGEPDIFGRGFLVADYPNLIYPYFDAVASMLRVNEKRLRLQKQYHMTEPEMLESHTRAQQFLTQAVELRNNHEGMLAMNMAGRALALAMTTHPAVREKLTNAVLGILWYLVLLVPFVLFFEKLAFGFTDIRKQLLAHGAIFIVVYCLLLAFHPAFKIVRSPLMILLGFLIAMLSIAVTLMMGGKFQQIIKRLRSKEGAVEGADVNRSGVVGTAFLLGLNNMRRRKVRTGLTCITLVLITFAMICFTSVSRNIQQEERTLGPASCSGLFRRDQNFAPLSQNELDALTLYYGLEYPVSIHHWFTGARTALMPKNAEIILEREEVRGNEHLTKSVTVNAAITMPWNEPQFSGIDKFLLTPNRGWFPRPPQTAEERRRALISGVNIPNYLFLPDTIANELGLNPTLVARTHQMVSVKGESYEVLGIFDAAKLAAHVGMDAQSILPYDLSTLTSAGKMADGSTRIPPSVKRLPASKVVITSKDFVPTAGTEQVFPVSCAVLFPQTYYQLRKDQPMHPPVTYREQHDLVTEYLERTGLPTYYSIENIAYYGRRFHGKNLLGILEMLIPLLLAALTVFNTMRGTVYERREEIYIYNALGIAPNHVFFMFMAEACVYGVVGAMFGYLLSQVTGNIMTALGVQGMNMDYSSIETIYASVIIVLSVLLSAILPARDAARLASPADEGGWSMPKVEGNRMQFNLPFTFTPHDRMAIISYFSRWFDANGEGSSGSFFSNLPQPFLREDIKTGETVPGIETLIWLKPFDYGVSQRLTIAFPTDPETGEYIALVTIEHASGSAEAWLRVMKPFMTALRKQFLNWRAVTNDERTEMFGESKLWFSETFADQATSTTDGTQPDLLVIA